MNTLSLRNKQRYPRPQQRHIPGNMNKQQYRQHLEILKQAGEIIGYRFEAIKFRLADKTFYTPDFMVTLSDRIEFHETKGFMRDDAAVKIKVVAEMFPEFVFYLCTYKKKLGKMEER